MILYAFTVIICLLSSCRGASIWGSECKVHIENSQAQLKQAIEKQSKFSLENWTHIGLITTLGLVCLLLVLAYCFFKAKYWPLIRNSHENKQAHLQYPKQQLGFQKPYIIGMNRERENEE